MKSKKTAEQRDYDTTRKDLLESLEALMALPSKHDQSLDVIKDMNESNASFKAAVMSSLQASDALVGNSARLESIDLLFSALVRYTDFDMNGAKLLLYVSGVILDPKAVETLLSLILTWRAGHVVLPSEVQPATIGNLNGVKVPVDVKTDMGKN